MSKRGNAAGMRAKIHSPPSIDEELCAPRGVDDIGTNCTAGRGRPASQGGEGKQGIGTHRL